MKKHQIWQPKEEREINLRKTYNLALSFLKKLTQTLDPDDKIKFK